MSGNVYLCYTGEYEDRAVHHVASTRELAVAWIDQECGCGRIHGQEPAEMDDGDHPEFAEALDEISEARRIRFGQRYSRERDRAFEIAQDKWRVALDRWEAEVSGPWYETHCAEWEIIEEEVDAE